MVENGDQISVEGSLKRSAWKAKWLIFKAIVAGFRAKVAQKNRTLGVPGGVFSFFVWFPGKSAVDVLSQHGGRSLGRSNQKQWPLMHGKI